MSVENDILEFIKRMNDCWTKGDPQELKKYFHQNMVAVTPTDKKRLEGKTACVNGWSTFAKNAKINLWREYDHGIQIYGNAAVVTYYFDINFEMGSQEINMSGRDMLTRIKENEKWWVAADQFSPFPA